MAKFIAAALKRQLRLKVLIQKKINDPNQLDKRRQQLFAPCDNYSSASIDFLEITKIWTK